MFSNTVNPVRVILGLGILLTQGLSSAMAAETLRGKVTAVAGKAELVLSTGRKPAVVGMELGESDRLETGSGGAIQVRFSDGSSFTVYEKSSIKIDQYRQAPQNRNLIDSVIDVAQGKLRFFVNPSAQQKKNAKFKTKSAVMGIRGTSGLIDAANPNQTQLLVLSGKVEVSNPRFPGRPVFVGANLMTSIPSGAAPTQPVLVSSDFVKSFVPPTPASGGFSDDSAAAASAFSGTSVGEEKKSKSAEDPKADEKDKQQSSDPAKEPEKEPAKEPAKEPSNTQQRDSKAPPAAAEPKTGSEQAPPRKDESVQRGQTLFAPGGEVIRPSAEQSQRSDAAVPSTAAKGNATGSKPGQPVTGSQDNLQPALKGAEQMPVVDIMRQVDRTTSQIKSAVETVEKNVQQTIQVTTTPTPGPQKIKIKVSMPEN